MVAHAREDLPNECCGMVGGADGVATEGDPGRQRGGQPAALRDGPAGAVRRAEGDRSRRRELLAIYHSHTKSAAYPSQTDVNQARNWPEPIYLIVSLADAESAGREGLPPRDLKIADAELEIDMSPETKHRGAHSRGSHGGWRPRTTRAAAAAVGAAASWSRSASPATRPKPR